MTDTTTSTASVPQDTGVLEHLDPTALVIESNVRTEGLAPDPEFVDSVRTHGVLVPVLGWRDSDGAVHVRAGQRRTLAARKAEVSTIPVYVVQADDDSTARRIVEQLVENEHRQTLTNTDRVAAWQQLTLEGLTVATIAKRTGAKRDQVTAGLAVAASSTGTSLLGDGITLDQAAAMVEFEDDPAVLADLTATAEQDPDYLPVAIQRARNERATRDTIRAAEEIEVALGHRILTSTPGWSEAPYALDRLTTSHGDPVEVEAVRGKAGVAVRMTTSWQGEVVVRYYLDDPEAFGFIRPKVTALPAPSGRQEGPMSEEAKAARRMLIARNKEWDAATTVRTEWLTNFLARKTLPKNATQVLAACLTGAHALVAESMSHGSSTAKALLGVDPGYGIRLDEYLRQHPGRALHVALAVALGGIEQTLTRETWRTPSPVTAAYLTTLAGWGYPLCPVERVAALLDPTAPEPEVEDDEVSVTDEEEHVAPEGE